MTQSEFEDLIDAYGGRLQCWPASERARVERYLQDNPGGLERLEDWQSLERLLAPGAFTGPGNDEPAQYANLVDRIMADVEVLGDAPRGCANDLSVGPEVQAHARKSKKQGLSLAMMACVLTGSLLLGLFVGGGITGLGLSDAGEAVHKSQTAADGTGVTVLDLLGL